MAIGMINNDPATLSFLFTAADVAVMPRSLPSGDVNYELNNGRLIAMPPPGYSHGDYQSNLATELKVQGERKGYGKCIVESGVLLWEDPDRLLGPDAMFVTNNRLPIKESSEGYLLTIPELIVEIRSKNDGDTYIAEKVSDYLKAGALVVWVADPGKRAVFEYPGSGATKTFGQKDTLEVEDVIPGFRMPVAEVFRQ
jgi:Uma2 family endonuclease